MSLIKHNIPESTVQQYSDKHGLMVSVVETQAHTDSKIGLPIYLSKKLYLEYIHFVDTNPMMLSDLLEMAKHHKRCNNLLAKFVSYWPQTLNSKTVLVKCSFNLHITSDTVGNFVLFIREKN